jgi:hypothetical protein
MHGDHSGGLRTLLSSGAVLPLLGILFFPFPGRTAAMDRTMARHTVKVAWLHHGNQHLSDNGELAGEHDHRPGYWATIDSHVYNNVSVDIHISGTLQQSYGWLQNGNGLLGALAGNCQIEMCGGNYSEHIMPYTDEDMNIFSLNYFQKVCEKLINPVGTACGNETNRPKVIWVPERVWKDFLIHDFAATYGYDPGDGWRPPCVVLDGNTAHDWYCTNTDPDHDHHNIHTMWNENGEEVLVAFICPHANENWLNPESVQKPWGYYNGHLQWLKDHTDQQKLCLYGDDWEKAAGVAGWWDNTAEYDSNIYWTSTQDWIQPVHVSEAAQWWGVEGDPTVIHIPYATYTYLHDWTGGNYDFWYDDSVVQWGKESMVTTQAEECQGAEDYNQNAISGDYEDLWKSAVENLRTNASIDISEAVYDSLEGHPYPGETAGIIKKLTPDNSYVPAYPADYGNRINRVGWTTVLSMLYETAWHSGTQHHMEGWAKVLHNHSRYGTAFAHGAHWLDHLPHKAEAIEEDFDGDGEGEYAIQNNRICAIFDRRGGRALWVFTADGDVIVGNSMSNFGNEGDFDEGAHAGLAHESQAENSWFDVTIEESVDDRAILYFEEKYDYRGYPSTDVRKRVSLFRDSPVLQIDYESDYGNWTKCDVSPDLKDLLESGYNLAHMYGETVSGYNYGGYRNLSSGAKGLFLWHPDASLTYNQKERLYSLAEKIEIGGRSGRYTILFYGGRLNPELRRVIMDGYRDRIVSYDRSDGDHVLSVHYLPSTRILYVAVDSAGDGPGEEDSDNFIFLSENPDALWNAPWSKKGRVGRWDAYLVDENDGAYCAWEDHGNSTVVEAASSSDETGVVEGTIDIMGEFGYIPREIFIAAVGYGNEDEEGVLWQIPPGDDDDIVEPDEFARYSYTLRKALTR